MTLSDINITPLIDLAFVLLIIFVIISPSIRSERENSIELNLPKGGSSDQPINPKNIRTLEAVPAGGYRLDGRAMTLEQVESALRSEGRSNPDLIVYIRIDGEDRVKRVATIWDFCEKERIQFSMATQP